MLNDKVGEDQVDYDNQLITVGGEDFPLFYRPIINQVVSDGMPIVCLHGDTGSGKTETATRIGYDLHEQVSLCRGEFPPSKNINFHPLPYLNRVRTSTRQTLVMEESGVNLNSKDWNDITNRKNRRLMDVARILNHVLIYVSPNHSDLSKSIRKNCNLKIVATGGIDTYEFKVYRIKQNRKDESTEQEELFIQNWKPDRPPKALRDKVEKSSRERKLEIMDRDYQELTQVYDRDTLEKKKDEGVTVGV